MTHEEHIIHLTEAVSQLNKIVKFLEKDQDHVWDCLKKQGNINDGILKQLREIK